jgi:hypothetical protein
LQGNAIVRRNRLWPREGAALGDLGLIVEQGHGAFVAQVG